MNDNQVQSPNTASGQDANTGEEKKKQEYISTGGFSPEIVSVSSEVNQEQLSSLESGYERLQPVEKSAETREKKEAIHKLRKPVQGVKKQVKRTEKSVKKHPSPLEDIKYFGYRPSKKYLRDILKIKKYVGKGDPGDTRTWLLVFLDRILRKESSSN